MQPDSAHWQQHAPWTAQQPPAWAAAPPPQKASAGVIVLLVINLIALLVNLGLTFYVFQVAQGIVGVAEQWGSIFGG
jgi:hypothetical protein